MGAAPFLAFLLLASAVPSPAQTEDAWTKRETAHFVIHQERNAASLGDDTQIEQIYERLHAELWSLTPWMATEKTHLYLYKDVDSYRRGRFHPPAWSGGLMQSSPEKALAIFEPIDPSVVAHELTHLYFHSYFDEKGSSPSPWLDEGLASLLGDQGLSLPDPRQKGPIIRSPMPLPQFFKTRPGQDSPGAWVGAWYGQAQSVVWFLKRGRSEAGFTELCAKLRAGEDVETALREAYGDESLDGVDDAWRKWRPTKPAGMLKGLGDQ